MGLLGGQKLAVRRHESVLPLQFCLRWVAACALFLLRTGVHFFVRYADIFCPFFDSVCCYYPMGMFYFWEVGTRLPL